MRCVYNTFEYLRAYMSVCACVCMPVYIFMYVCVYVHIIADPTNAAIFPTYKHTR